MRRLSPDSTREIERLAAFGRELRRELVIAGGRRLAWTLVLAVGASLLLDRWLRFGPSTLLVLRVALALVLLRELVRRVGRPAVEAWPPLTLAAAVDPRGWLARRIATLLQLEPRLAHASGERALLERAVTASLADLAGYDYSGRLDRARARSERWKLGWICAAPLVAAAFFPSAASTWFSRWVLGRHAAWPQETYLVVQGLRDGALVVPRGEPFELFVRAREGSVVPDEVRLRAAVDGEESFAILVRFGPNDFRHGFDGLATDGRMWLSGGDERLGPIPILARDRPRVLGLSVTAELADADYREETTLGGASRDLAFLAGTRVTLEGRSDQDLSAVRLSGVDPGEVALDRPAADHFRLRWTHRRALPLALELEGAVTGLDSHPRALPIGLRRDRPPRITLARTGVRDRVTPMARVPCRAIAQDDFGVARVHVSLATGAWGVGDTLELWSADAYVAGEDEELAKSREEEVVVSLGELGLEVGAVVQVNARARDRCHTGAQTGRSRPVVLRVVEPGQLMAEIAARLALARAALRQAWEQARDLEDEMQSADVARSVDWLRRHRLIDRTVWQTQRTLSDGVRELALNALIDEQAEALLRQRALDPLDRLAEEGMREQRAALEASVGGEPVPLEELSGNQSRIVEEMRRVLDGMEQWDSFVDLVNHLNEILRLQEEVREATREVR